jgi:stress response protein YsnF
VDRPVDAANAAFQERTIEATETTEEPVVSKEARVREEVVIRKTADDETRTVSDTVRRTEVKVEDDRKTATPSGKPAPGATRNPGV